MLFHFSNFLFTLIIVNIVNIVIIVIIVNIVKGAVSGRRQFLATKSP